MALGGSHGISREPLAGRRVWACESIAGVNERAQGCGRLCTMTWGAPDSRVASIVLSCLREETPSRGGRVNAPLPARTLIHATPPPLLGIRSMRGSGSCAM